MASVIARSRCAEERERGERARDHQTVNGEKIFISVTSAECTEVSMSLNGIPSHHLKTATRQTRAILRRGRGADVLHRAYKWSSIFQATQPQLPPDLFICWKFTTRSTTTKCSSAGLLTAPSSFAMQSALPLAKETLLPLRQFVPSPWLCPMPLFHCSIGGNCAQASALALLGGACGQPRLRGIRNIFRALF